MSIADEAFDVQWSVTSSYIDANDDLQTIYIPRKAGILVDFIICIQGEKIDRKSLPILTYTISQAFLRGSTWKQLQFDPHLLVVDDESTFKSLITCQLFRDSPLWQDIEPNNSKIFLSANKLQVVEFNALNIAIDIHRVDSIDDLFCKLNMSMASLLINLESKYPIVWNYYSRQLFQSSFGSLRYLHNATKNFNIQWIEILIGFLKQVNGFDKSLHRELILSKRSFRNNLNPASFPCVHFFSIHTDL